MRTWAAATIGAPSSAYIPASEPKQTIIATAEWMMLRSVTTAIPAPTTPMASRKKRTLEMSRVVAPVRMFERSMARSGAAPDSSVTWNPLRASRDQPVSFAHRRRLPTAELRNQ